MANCIAAFFQSLQTIFCTLHEYYYCEGNNLVAHFWDVYGVSAHKTMDGLEDLFSHVKFFG